MSPTAEFCGITSLQGGVLLDFVVNGYAKMRCCRSNLNV